MTIDALFSFFSSVYSVLKLTFFATCRAMKRGFIALYNCFCSLLETFFRISRYFRRDSYEKNCCENHHEIFHYSIKSMDLLAEENFLISGKESTQIIQDLLPDISPAIIVHGSELYPPKRKKKKKPIPKPCRRLLHSCALDPIKNLPTNAASNVVLSGMAKDGNYRIYKQFISNMIDFGYSSLFDLVTADIISVSQHMRQIDAYQSSVAALGSNRIALQDYLKDMANELCHIISPNGSWYQDCDITDIDLRHAPNPDSWGIIAKALEYCNVPIILLNVPIKNTAFEDLLEKKSNICIATDDLLSMCKSDTILFHRLVQRSSNSVFFHHNIGISLSHIEEMFGKTDISLPPTSDSCSDETTAKFLTTVDQQIPLVSQSKIRTLKQYEFYAINNTYNIVIHGSWSRKYFRRIKS